MRVCFVHRAQLHGVKLYIDLHILKLFKENIIFEGVVNGIVSSNSHDRVSAANSSSQPHRSDMHSHTA